jgi:hypothetical protein
MKNPTDCGGSGGAEVVDQLDSRVGLRNRPSFRRLQIVVAPTGRGKWRATLGGRTLCVAAAPLVKSARILIAEGFGPNLVIEMWRAGTDAWALRGRLGVVAATLLDGETAAPHAKNGVPVRFLGKAASSKGGGA